MLIIFWRGYGFIVPIILVLTLGLSIAVFEYMSGPPEIAASGLVLVAFGVLLWSIGNRFTKRDSICLIESKGMRFLKKHIADTFYCIRVKHWGWIMIFLGLFLTGASIIEVLK